MDNVPSVALGQQIPISKLNRDLLWEIFGQWDSLDGVRNSSQVCRKWRGTLLESPSIWARNVELDALDQKSDCWRNLVLKRTGRAMLSVTGTQVVHSISPSLDFLANLLDKHWARIRDLGIIITLPASDDERFWKAFGCPAPALRTFSCTLSPAHPIVRLSFLQNLPSNFQLFSNHAPSLVCLKLGEAFPPINLDVTRQKVFTSNLTKLRLARTSALTDIDLLTACMQMPSLEELSLSLTRFVRSPRSETDAFRPPLPRLKWIELTDANPSIYPTFLDRITPPAGCGLYINHLIDAWSNLAEDESNLEAEDLAHMRRVVGRYANSDIEYEAAPFLSILLVIAERSFGFNIPVLQREIEIGARTEHHVSYSRPNFLSLLLESLLTIELPQSFTTMDLLFSYRDNFLSHALPLQAFCSMTSITVLKTDSAGLSYLGRFKQTGLPFPRLNTIFLSESSRGQDVNSLQECIHPFLAHRYHTAPIEVLKIDIIFRETTDLRFLDTLSGLKVVVRVYTGQPSTFKYVCGSGDEQCLYFQAHPDSNGQ